MDRLKNEVWEKIRQKGHDRLCKEIIYEDMYGFGTGWKYTVVLKMALNRIGIYKGMWSNSSDEVLGIEYMELDENVVKAIGTCYLGMAENRRA